MSRDLLPAAVPVLMAVLLAALALRPAHAGSITLSPAVVPLAGQPGQSTAQTLSLHNDTDLELAFDLAAVDVVVVDGHRVWQPAGATPGGVAASAVFRPAQLTVPAHGTASAEVRVTLPPGTRTRAMVALLRGSSRVAVGGGAATLSLGTLLTFRLSDALDLAAEVAVEPQSETANTVVDARFANDGSEPVLAHGAAVILDDAGRVVGRLAFDDRRLLPGERGAVSAEYAGQLAPGRYRAVSTFEYEGRTTTRTAEFEVR